MTDSGADGGNRPAGNDHQNLRILVLVVVGIILTVVVYRATDPDRHPLFIGITQKLSTTVSSIS